MECASGPVQGRGSRREKLAGGRGRQFIRRSPNSKERASGLVRSFSACQRLADSATHFNHYGSCAHTGQLMAPRGRHRPQLEYGHCVRQVWNVIGGQRKYGAFLGGKLPVYSLLDQGRERERVSWRLLHCRYSSSVESNEGCQPRDPVQSDCSKRYRIAHCLPFSALSFNQLALTFSALGRHFSAVDHCRPWSVDIIWRPSLLAPPHPLLQLSYCCYYC